jgi:hypothetical protein
MMCLFNFRQIVALLAATAIAASVSGCGRTLVFGERDGVNLAIRADATSSPPIQANFGLNRTVGTIVPSVGQTKDGAPKGEAVSMFSGFQVDNTINVQKSVDADLQVDTQFASGKAAIAIADKPSVVARVVNPSSVTFSSSDTSKQLQTWLLSAPGGNLSQRRSDALQAWLKTRYPNRLVRPGLFLENDDAGEFEAGRKAALSDTALMNTPP